MIFCAMGKGGSQEADLASIAALPQKAFQISDQISSPVLTDFHMVGGGYDEDDPWELECIPKTSLGKKAVNGGAKLTRRDYLQNAKFAVIQAIPKAWEEAVVKAFQEPVWDIYLGRKCCAPSLPVFGGIFESEDAALNALKAEVSSVYGDGNQLVAVWEEVPMQTEGSMTLADVPVAFGKRKRYKQRTVKFKSLVE